jgi:hypothetical protein
MLVGMGRFGLVAALAVAGGLTACGGSGTDAATPTQISSSQRSRFEQLIPERQRQAALLRKNDLAANFRVLELVALPAGTRALGRRVVGEVGYYRPPAREGELTAEEEAAFAEYVRDVLPGEADALLSTGYSTTLELEAPPDATAEEVWEFFVGRLRRPWVAIRSKRLRGAPGELHFYRDGRCLVVRLAAGTPDQLQGRFDVSAFPTDPANADYC